MGMRFDDRITGRLDRFAANAKVIHFELDKAEVGKNIVPDVAVVGDLAETLPAYLPPVKERRHQDWIETLNEWRSETDEADIIQYEVEELIPPFVIRQLWHATEQADKRVIVVTDVGQHQMWGKPVLYPRTSRNAAHQRRTGHDGIRAAGRARRTDVRPASISVVRGR